MAKTKENTDKFVQEWMPKDEQLILFYRGLNEFLKEYLENKFDEFDNSNSKIIADPLLGYIHFSALEIAIIDTKLFQRLRKIRQLGLAYLVFPSLEYSRFEHSLGVLGRLNQIVNKLIENNIRNNPDDNIQKIIDKHINALRLAALLHDVGHCLFSHCSERVVENLKGEGLYPSTIKIQEIFSEHFNKTQKIPFAELFSISIIGSVHFYNYIKNLGIHTPKDLIIILENAAKLIIGLPIQNDPNTIFLSQLISSGLDVDKVDYMIREQHYSGIKLEIDLDRILSKLQVFDISIYELPLNLNHLKKEFHAEARCKVLGFAKGGQFAYEEFCIARLALHVKVYLHQKVRAAEAQLSMYLRLIAENVFFQKAHNWLYLPEFIIEYPEIVEKYLEVDLFNQTSSIIECKNKLTNISNRNILHRAYAFGPINNISESIENSNYSEETLSFFYTIGISPDVFEKEFKKEIMILVKRLNVSIDKNGIEDTIIDFPRLMSIQQGHQSLYFERGNLIPLKWTIPIDKITVYFQENRALAYVFAPKSICGIVGIASEKVVFNLTKKVFNLQGFISKSSFASFTKIKAELSQSDYYKKTPQLKDTSTYLKSGEAVEKVKTINEKLASFKSLNNNERVTLSRIITFVNQFPENLQSACLSFLQHIEIYNENLLTEELNKVIERLKDKKIGLSYLGGASDSAGRFPYYLRSLLEKNNLEIQNLTDNLINDADVIILYDDNINSGLQLLNIFAELLGEKENLADDINLVNEGHIKPLLTPEAKEKFKTIPIYLVYIVGAENIETKVRKMLQDNLKIDGKNVHISINKVLLDNKKIFSGSESDYNHEQKALLKNFLLSKGEQLLKSEGKGSNKIETCKLGYANAEAMVFFPYNVPTMTITPLWLSGETDGEIWIPLAERRRRRSKDGKIIGED